MTEGENRAQDHAVKICCYCANYTRKCSYHQGYADGVDEMLALLARYKSEADARSVAAASGGEEER